MSMKIIAPIAAGVLLAMAGAAQAGTKTTTFQVTTTVTDNCTISATDLDLGLFDGSTVRTSTSTITVNCTSGTTYDVDLSPGASGDALNRKMYDGTAFLDYNLYTDGSYGTVWGNDLGGTGRPVTTPGAGMAVAQTLTVHGRLPLTANNLAAEAGNYADTITATITY